MDYKYFILFAGFLFSLLTAFVVYSWLSRTLRFSEARANLLAGWIPRCWFCCLLSRCCFMRRLFMILSATLRRSFFLAAAGCRRCRVYHSLV